MCKNSLLNLFHKLVASDISTLCKQFWIPQQTIYDALTAFLRKHSQFNDYERIVISGETDNISIYLLSQDRIILYTPFMNALRNIIVIEQSPKVIAKFKETLCLFENTTDISKRLDFPKVLLINPAVKEVFPTPRLALCVGSLASYLRKYQRASVFITDMQVDWTIPKIMEYIEQIQPDVIGISISFGQMNPATSLLGNIFAPRKALRKKPPVICGNVISSFAYKELLQMFPELIVCLSEGELSIAGIIDHIQGKLALGSVPGIAYKRDGAIQTTPKKEVNMDDLPMPAMDTVQAIIRNNGALTMEISRGCSHSACSFCPRTHKPLRWKGMSALNVVKQIEHYKEVFDAFPIERRLFMADEEFVGWMKSGRETARVNKIMEGLNEKHTNIKFETNTRIDQIYNPEKGKDWHIARMKMFTLCKKSGLERLLVGVESGCNSILKRFNKNISKNDSVFAIRILTALGVKMRITFITFDPLMTLSELKENIDFLERADIYLKEITPLQVGYSELFDSINDERFVRHNSLNLPFYEFISYMLVSLDVLINCNYLSLLAAEEVEQSKELILNKTSVDVNMARYKVAYMDEKIGEIAISCQSWIDKHFAFDYCLKGMYKTAKDYERDLIFAFRAKYRKISFYLLKSLVWILDETGTTNLEGNIVDNETLLRIREHVTGAKRKMNNTLTLFNKEMESMVKEVEHAMAKGKIKDNNKMLKNVIKEWKRKRGWSLINP